MSMFSEAKYNSVPTGVVHLLSSVVPKPPLRIVQLSAKIVRFLFLRS